MPYIITKKNGKRWPWPHWAKPLLSSEVEKFSHDGRANGDCWQLTNVVTRRTVTVGACKRETPSNLWGSKRRRGLRDGVPAPAAPPAAPAAKPVAGWWPFGKKKPRVNPMSKRMIWVPGEAPRVMDKNTAINPMTRHGQQILGRARKRRRR